MAKKKPANPGRNLQALLNYNFAQLEALQNGDLVDCRETSSIEHRRILDTAKATAILSKSVLDIVAMDMECRKHADEYELDYEGELEWQKATPTLK